MKQGIEGGYATPVRTHEKSPLTDREKVLSALEHNLSGVALERWMGMKPSGSPVSSFTKWVEDFNQATPEERGRGRYDHSRTGDEDEDVSEELNTASGFPLTVTLHKNGEVTLATSLSQ